MTVLHVLPYAIRLALLCWYAALIQTGNEWWAVPLLVVFSLGWGCGKPPKATP